MKMETITVFVFLSVLLFPGVSGNCQGSKLFITAPETIQALTGSCVLIPCIFKYESDMFDSKEKIFGVWIKNTSKFADDPNNVIFNSTNDVSIYDGNITENLQQLNCTTVFYNVNRSITNNYFFRMESASFRATAVCTNVTIKVEDSPPRLTLKIPNDLKEGQSVNFTCSAPTPCPDSAPRVTWNLPESPARSEPVKDQDGTFRTVSNMALMLSDRDDRRRVNCSAEYPVDGEPKMAETSVTLNVSYGPKETKSAIRGKEGDQVNLTCSSRANPPVSRFTWFKKAIGGEEEKVAEGADVSVTFTDGEVYFCEASNGVGGAKRSAEIHLTGKSLQWELIVGAIAAFVVVVCVVVFVWCLKRKRPPVQQTQSPAGGDHTDPQPDGENIHYGELSFSKRTTEASVSSYVASRDSGQTQDTLYAAVKVSSSTGDQEDVYAQVKEH